MGSTREKGKIAHSEWPKILARYNGGETIASIGRAYGCTAPAIRYIVKRSGMLKEDGARRSEAGGSRPSGKQRSRFGTLASFGGDASLESAALPLTIARGRRASGKEILGVDLRKRVSGDIASFLVALDQAVLDGSIESAANLQEATDRLMRSAARTRLELERLLGGYEGVRADGIAAEKAASAPHRDA